MKRIRDEAGIIAVERDEKLAAWLENLKTLKGK